MKRHLVAYCLLFSILFVLFYSYISDQASCSGYRYGVTRRDSEPIQDSKAWPLRSRVNSSPRKDDGLIRLEDWTPSRYETIRQGCPEIPRPLLVLAMCKQTKPISLADFFTETMRATLTKIGEGTFSDVFGCQKEGWDKLAVKIIPIEGHSKYNGELQNTFESIQTETVVSIELSLLGDESRRNDQNVLHYTRNFMQIERVGICYGKFPAFLLEAWDDSDFRKESNNDRPSMFPQNQLYVAFSAENSGVQLLSYVYHSYEAGISILQQISATVAVGEAALQFEHRDMHRGNVLVRRTHEEYIYFRLDGVEYSIKSYGAVATIVDYTLSRVKQEKTECTSYINLDKMSWLFRGKGDIQFDVYRDIRNHTQGKWEGFYPYTNVLFLNFLATKTTFNAKLKRLSTRTWKANLRPFLDQIREQDSGKDVFLNVFSPKAVKRLRATIPEDADSRHSH